MAIFEVLFQVYQNSGLLYTKLFGQVTDRFPFSILFPYDLILLFFKSLLLFFTDPLGTFVITSLAPIFLYNREKFRAIFFQFVLTHPIHREQGLLRLRIIVAHLHQRGIREDHIRGDILLISHLLSLFSQLFKKMVIVLVFNFRGRSARLFSISCDLRPVQNPSYILLPTEYLTGLWSQKQASCFRAFFQNILPDQQPGELNPLILRPLHANPVGG